MEKPSRSTEAHLELSFAKHSEAFTQATDAIIRLANAVCEPLEMQEGEISEEEMVVEITDACKQAIRESGLSREQILERVNGLLGRTGENDSKRPISIHMFNNYLSKSHEFPIRYTLIKAIAKITRSKRIAQVFVRDLSMVVIRTDDQIELWLGKWELHKERGDSAKRQLLSHLSERGKPAEEGSRIIGKTDGDRPGAKALLQDF
jgi:hypothetical protein